MKIPHTINMSPIYLARQARATPDARNIRDFMSFSFIYELAKIKLTTENKIKIGSDHAILETDKSTHEKAIARVVKIAIREFARNNLKANSPLKYIIDPNIMALRISAILRGSEPDIIPRKARADGYNGAHLIMGFPLYLVNPLPFERFLATLIYFTESGESPAS